MSSFTARLEALRTRIHAASAAASSERDAPPAGAETGAEPLLVAVGKGHPVAALREAYAAGIRDFGENYVQEWREKRAALADLPGIRWHFIGQLQSNKVKFLLEPLPPGQSLLIHSVDRPELVEAIAKRAQAPVDVLLQVEVSSLDHTKAGVPQNEAMTLAALVASSPALRLRGFMGIGPIASPAELSTLYPQWIACVEHCWRSFPQFAGKALLSLGMSDDLEIALQAGSNLLRVGTALFGERPRK